MAEREGNSPALQDCRAGRQTKLQSSQKALWQINREHSGKIRASCNEVVRTGGVGIAPRIFITITTLQPRTEIVVHVGLRTAK